MNRKEKLITNEYYHIYNRGVEKRVIFPTIRDYQRFLDILFHYLETNERFSFAQGQNIRSATTDADEVASQFAAPVSLVCYCLMPNHFHLLLKQLIDKGITNYMHRISTSLTNYFNLRERRVGPLLQGQFKYKRVESEEQLIYLSKYIHRNPLELGPELGGKQTQSLTNHPWSSLADYLKTEAETKPVLFREPVLGLFDSTRDYRKFVLEDLGNKDTEILGTTTFSEVAS